MMTIVVVIVPRAIWLRRTSVPPVPKLGIGLSGRLDCSENRRAGRRSDAIGAGIDHRSHVVEVANAARRLDADARANGGAQQPNVGNARASRWMKPGRRLDESSASTACEPTCQLLLAIGQRRGLEDHLDRYALHG